MLMHEMTTNGSRYLNRENFIAVIRTYEGFDRRTNETVARGSCATIEALSDAG